MSDMSEIVEQVIRARQTVKVLADRPLDVATDRGVIEAIVASGGWAPFHLLAARVHRDEGELRAIVPWRCHLLDVAACRALRDWLLERDDTSTMPQLLAACSALVMVTWLPDPPRAALDPTLLFDATRENMEHIAAASAAVQNMLLAATARGLASFWATALPLRAPASFAYLGIPVREILLGALFLASPDVAAQPGVETKVSTLRDRRGEPDTWSRWVQAGA